MRVLFLMFIIIPIIEIYILLQVSAFIGALPTVLAVVATAVLGVALLKQQGYQVLFNAQSKMAAGTMPAGEVIEGIMLAVGGALLLTPGFMTDAIGFSLLIPGLRHLWIKLFKPRLMTRPQGFDQNRSSSSESNSKRSQPSNTSNSTIDGEYRRED